MYNRTFLFITTNDNEWIAFREKFTIEKTPPFSHGTCVLGNFGIYKVWHCSLSVQGAKIQTEITNIIEFVKPDAIILVGIACGGYEETLGDVLVSEKIIDYDFHKIDDTIEPRGEIFTCGEVLYRFFQSPDNRLTWQIENQVKVYCGEMFCSTSLLNNYGKKKEIFKTRDNYPIGYEMEGITVVRACRDKNISQLIIVKGVSDFGDGTKNKKSKEEQDKDQLFAARNAVSYCHYVFSKDGLGNIQKATYNTPMNVENNLPDQNIFFSGREREIYDLKNLFANVREINAINICQTVSGLGGVGKTALAIEYAYRYSKNYKNAIWFVVAESSMTIYDGFVEFAKHFEILLPPKFKPEELQKTIKSWLSEHEGWLLIFDNLETDETIIKPYLPQSINGHYIITTRNTHIGIEKGKQVNLGVFNIDEAVEFFKKSFSKDSELKMEHYSFTGCNDFEEQVPILAKRLGLLPLALEQAAAYIRTVRKTITDYLSKLDEVGLESFKNERGYATPTNYKSIVTATWKVSFDKLREEEQQLFNLCAYMAPDKIPVNFFVEMKHKLPEELKVLKEKLTRDSAELTTEFRHYSLATGDAYKINIHRLVQEVVRESLGTNYIWLVHGLGLMCERTEQYIDKNGINIFMAESLHAISIAENAYKVFEDDENSLNIAKIFYAVSTFNALLSLDVPALSHIQKCIEILEKLRTSNVPLINESDLLKAYKAYLSDINENHLYRAYMTKGMIYNSMAKFDEAIKNFDISINMGEKLLITGKLIDKGDLANVYTNRGLTYENIKKNNNALNDKSKGIAILEQLYQDGSIRDKHNLAIAYMNRGITYLSMSLYDNALTDTKRSIDIWERMINQGEDIQVNDLAKDLAKARINIGVILSKISFDNNKDQFENEESKNYRKTSLENNKKQIVSGEELKNKINTIFKNKK